MRDHERITRISRFALAPRARQRKLLYAAAALFLSGVFSPAAHGQQIMKGQICAAPSGSTPDPSKVQCNVAHPKKGNRLVFLNLQDKAVYQIEGKKTNSFAGTTVLVIGSVDRRAGTIHISDIYHAMPPKVARAKTLYIDCDACPRAMASAWRAAFDALSEWGRFDITPDPMKADLVLIVSANPYLGDYATRDGPDKRPVYIEITYMNVVDPHTGESFWGDWKRMGSWLVTRATKDLVNEFRDQMKLEDAAAKT